MNIAEKAVAGNGIEDDLIGLNIYRLPKDAENKFVMVDKRVLYDKDLSWEAKGLLAYMLSKPDDWQFYQNELRKHGSAGRDKFRRILKELEMFGYINRFKWQDSNGRWMWSWEVYESPALNPDCDGYEADILPCTENPSTVNPSLVQPSTVQPSLEKASVYLESIINTDKTNTDKTKSWLQN